MGADRRRLVPLTVASGPGLQTCIEESLEFEPGAPAKILGMLPLRHLGRKTADLLPLSIRR
jgi:hypothetical protein